MKLSSTYMVRSSISEAPVKTVVEYRQHSMGIQVTGENVSEELNIPYTIWTMEPEQLEDVRRFCKQTYFLKRNIIPKNVSLTPDVAASQVQADKGKQQFAANYHFAQFTDEQIERAISNALNPQVFQQILSGLLSSQFKVLIIGPAPIANLLGRSLNIFLPPN